MIQSARSDKIFLSINNIVLGIFLITVLYPIWIVLVSSFSDPTYVSAGKVWLWPVGFSLDGYRAILDYKTIVSGFGNSIVIMVLGTVLCIVVTLLGATRCRGGNWPARKQSSFSSLSQCTSAGVSFLRSC